MSHRIIVMREGLIVEEAETENLFSRAKDPYTKCLIKSSFDILVEKGS